MTSIFIFSFSRFFNQIKFREWHFQKYFGRIKFRNLVLIRGKSQNPQINEIYSAMEINPLKVFSFRLRIKIILRNLDFGTNLKLFQWFRYSTHTSTKNCTNCHTDRNHVATWFGCNVLPNKRNVYWQDQVFFY